jgi:hypothetical protein
MSYQFLSDDWLAAVKALADEAAGSGVIPPDVTLDLQVIGGPTGDRELHVAGGSFGAGFVDAPTKLTLPYATARSMFLDGDQAAAMQAFMSGQITIQGDMSKLMAMQQGGGAGSGGEELQKKMQEITAPE